jgi:hypothetical protein
LVAVRPVLVASEAITERLVSADVHWDYLDERGNSARQEDYVTCCGWTRKRDRGSGSS